MITPLPTGRVLNPEQGKSVKTISDFITELAIARNEAAMWQHAYEAAAEACRTVQRERDALVTLIGQQKQDATK